MLSPNILALVTNSRGLPFISTGSKFGGDFEKQILNSLHLASLSSKSFDRDCADRLSIASFTWQRNPFYMAEESLGQMERIQTKLLRKLEP